MKNSRNAMTVIGVAAVLLLGTGCGATTVPETRPAEEPSVTSTVKASAEPSTVDLGSEGGVQPGTVINGVPTQKDLAQDENGPFIQSTIEVDDPAMKYNASIVESTALEAYSVEDILKAQQFIVRHIAEEGIDSTLNGTKANPELIDKWWAAHKDKYDPLYSAEVPVRLASNDKVVMPLYRYTGEKSKLISGENVTHVNSRSITPAAIRAGELDGKMRLGFQVYSETVYNIVTESGNKTVNAVSADWNYTLTKNDATGEWIISGYQNTFTSDVA